LAGKGLIDGVEHAWSMPAIHILHTSLDLTLKPLLDGGVGDADLADGHGRSAGGTFRGDDGHAFVARFLSRGNGFAVLPASERSFDTQGADAVVVAALDRIGRLSESAIIRLP
jgi:hypothetical protein